MRIAEHLTIPSGGFKLASTVERFCIPNDLMAIVHDKSTWARLGIVVQNTVAEPGWRGYLTLELTNHSRQPIEIWSGTRLRRWLFHMLSRSANRAYSGKTRTRNKVRSQRSSKQTERRCVHLIA